MTDPIIDAEPPLDGGGDVTFEFIAAPDTPTVPQPMRMSRIDFLRLFTTAEIAGFNAVRAQVSALIPADYAAAAGGDQMMQLLVGFGVFLTHYDALSDQIELDHPETAQGLGLLVPMGVLTADRLTAVLAGEPRPGAVPA